MSLMKCPDCHREVSDQAPACLGCGRPMVPLEGAVDRTVRDGKRLQAVGTLEVLLALPAFAFVTDPQRATFAWVWLGGLLALGFGTLIYARVGAWWRHR